MPSRPIADMACSRKRTRRLDRSKDRHLPRAMAAVLALAVRPFHPGVARMLRLSSLPDEVFSETLDAEELVREYRLNLIALEEFVREQVQRWRASAHAASAQLTA